MLRESEKLQKQKQKEKAKGTKAKDKEKLQSAIREANEEEARLKAAKEADETAGPPAPEPPGTLPLKDTTLAHDFMVVWAFASSFRETLVLAPFSPENLCAALQRPGESVLLAELHVRMLRTLLHEIEALRKQQVPAPLDSVMLLQQVPPAVAVSSANWPELLRNLGAVLPQLLDVCHQQATLVL